MIRILHLADLHLGRSHRYLGEKAPARKSEADSLLRRVVDRVLGGPLEVDVVVVAGDLFETYKPEDARVGEVIGVLGRLVEAGKTVITLPGNHDELSYHECVYRTHAGRWPGVLVTSPHWTRVATVKTAGGPCHFYGLAYQAGITGETLETSIPLEPGGLHVAILHASVDLPGGDRSIHTTSKVLGDLGVDYVALGHVHKPGMFRLPKGLAVYPGLIEGSGFDDPGCGELTLVTLGEGPAAVERLPFPARRIATEAIDVSSLEDAGALVEHIRRQADPDLILRVRLVGAAGFDVSSDLLAAQLADRFHHLEIEADATRMAGAEVEAAAGEETVLGAALRDLRARAAATQSDEDRAVVDLAIRRVWEAFRGGREHA